MEGCDDGLLVGDELVLGMSDGSLDGWLLGCDVGLDGGSEGDPLGINEG